MSLLKSMQFVGEYLSFRRIASQAKRRFSLHWSDRWVCLHDRTAETSFDRHYVFHPAWAARVLAKVRPSLHVDVGSSLHFVSIVSAFIPVNFYDLRPAELGLEGLQSGKGNLMSLPFAEGTIESLSCMHVIEHVGLGRYGDTMDYDGDLKAIAELKRVLAPGGNLLFVVPVGTSRIQYNAHRIYSYQSVLDLFQGYELREFALIPDHARDGGLLRGASAELSDRQTYGCGCFWFVKGS